MKTKKKVNKYKHQKPINKSRRINRTRKGKK